MIPERFAGARPGGHRARGGRARQPDGHRASGTTARAAAHVAQRPLKTPAAQEAIAGRTIYRQQTIRMFGLPESGLAETLRDGEKSVPGFDALEITTCLRRGEIEMVTRYEPRRRRRLRAADGAVARKARAAALSPKTARSVDDLVAQLLAGRRIATAESCTAGLLAARLTDRPGSSDYVAGGVVRLLQRGESRAARRRPGPDRNTRRGVRAGGRGDGDRRAAALRRRHRRRDHRNRRAGRRHSRKAGRHGLFHRDARRRPQRTPARCGSPGTGPTSGSARRRWRCTCCGAY